MLQPLAGLFILLAISIPFVQSSPPPSLTLREMGKSFWSEAVLRNLPQVRPHDAAVRLADWLAAQTYKSIGGEEDKVRQIKKPGQSFGNRPFYFIST